MKICFGAKVVCQRGEEAGEVARVIIATETLEATHIVIRAGRRTAPDQAQGRLVPLSMVQGSTERGLILHSTLEQLAQVPRFVPEAYVTAESAAGEQRQAGMGAGLSAPPQVASGDVEHERRSLAPRHVSVALGRDYTVGALDGPLGPLAGVRLDLYTNRLASIIVDKGVVFNRQVDVPAMWVSEIGPRQVKLATTVQQAAEIVGPEAGPYLAVEGEEEAGAGGGR